MESASVAHGAHAAHAARGAPELTGSTPACWGCHLSSSPRRCCSGRSSRPTSSSGWCRTSRGRRPRSLPGHHRAHEHGDPLVVERDRARSLRSIKSGNRTRPPGRAGDHLPARAIFLTTQVNEYFKAGFPISDGAFASVFYGLTGLHGAHVFVGLTLLAMVNLRTVRGHFRPEAHMGVETAGIYWHFVDVMWIIVWSTVYLL